MSETVAYLASDTDQLAETLRIAAVLTDVTSRSDDVRSLGHVLQGYLEAAGGRWDAAERAFHEANATVPGTGVLPHAWLAALPFLDLDADRRREIRDSLTAWTPPATHLVWSGSMEQILPLPGMYRSPTVLIPHVRHYILGLLSAGLGDSAEATRYASLLRNTDEPADSIGLLSDLAAEILAFAALQRRDTVTALAILEGTSRRVATHYGTWDSPFHTRQFGAWLRAEALAALGTDEEARGWYAAALWGRNIVSWVLMARLQLRLGDLAEQGGDAARARYHLERFVARWSNADAPYQPAVMEVRERLEHLTP